MLEKKRMLIWGGLLAGLAGAIALLLVAQSRRGGGGDSWDITTQPEPKAVEYLEITIVDEAGQPVPDAVPFVAQVPGAAGAEPLEAEAAWRIPTVEGGVPIAIQARGFRVHEVDRVKESGPITLPRGIVIRVLLRERPVLPGAPYRLYFQVRPEREDWRGLNQKELDALVALMDSVAPPPEDVRPSTREEFGYEVSQDQAEAGVLLPRPGKYDIRWGLFDVSRQLWYSLEEGTTTTVEVKDQKAPQIIDISIGTEDVDRTRAELDAIETETQD